VPDTVWTIVVAGGTGRRFGRPKQFEDLGGRRVLDWAVGVAAGASDGVVLVVPAADVGGEADHVRPGTIVVAGGASRTESVRNGLAAVPGDATIVCVHDAARPFAPPAMFAAVVAAVRDGAEGAVPGVPVSDTVKVVDAAGAVVTTPDRSTLVAVQTPQAFRAGVLRRAHDTARAGGHEGTDDAALVEAIGGRVVVVPGDPANRKVTHPDDLAWARDRVVAMGTDPTGRPAGTPTGVPL